MGDCDEIPALQTTRSDVIRLFAEPVTKEPVEIVLNRGDRMRRLHGDGMVEEQPTRLLAGQLTRAISIAPTGRLDLVGIRFHPWAAASFVGVSGAELRDRMLPLDALSRLDRAMARAQEVDDDIHDDPRRRRRWLARRGS